MDSVDYLLHFGTDEYKKVFFRDFECSMDTKEEIVKKTQHIQTLNQLMTSSVEGRLKAVNIVNNFEKCQSKYKWIEKELLSMMSESNQLKTYTSKTERNATKNPYAIKENYTKKNSCLTKDYSSPKENSLANDIDYLYIKSLVILLQNLVEGCSDVTERKIIIQELNDVKIPQCLGLMSDLDYIKNSELQSFLKQFLMSLQTVKVQTDPNDPYTLFNSVWTQIKDTPQSRYFKILLQNLLQTDSSNPHFNFFWETISKFTGKTNVTENQNELKKIFRDEQINLETDKKHAMSNCKISLCTCACHGNATVIAPPPPAPPPPPPPPPSLPLNLSNMKQPHSITADVEKDKNNNNNLSKMIKGCHPIKHPNDQSSNSSNKSSKPPLAPSLSSRTFDTVDKSVNQFKLKIPIPNKKMKKLQWSKIQTNLVVGKKSVWSNTLSKPDQLLSKQIDFFQLEMMFGRADDPVSKVSVTETEEKRKKIDEITLLDGKRSLNINIFLHQIKMTHEELIKGLVDGCNEILSVEKLKGLIRILPEKEELELVKSFKGDSSKLGNAEKFYQELCNYPTFQKSVETHLMKEEFEQTTETLVPSLECISQSIHDIRNNKLLPELFEIVLLAGNFLNTGGYAGEAVAFKLQSLLKLTDIKSNVQGINLMHYLAETAVKNNAQMKALSHQLNRLKETTQYSLESVIGDISSLRTKLKTMEDNIAGLTRCMADKLEGFIKGAKESLAKIEEERDKLHEAKKDLAVYFCEDLVTFKLDDCFYTINSFVLAFDKAIKENEKKEERMNSISKMHLRRQGSLDLASKARMSNRQSLNMTSFDEKPDESKLTRKRHSMAPTTFDSSVSLTSMSSDQDNMSVSTSNASDTTSEQSYDLIDLLNSSCINNGFCLDNNAKIRRRSKCSENKSRMNDRERYTGDFSTSENNEFVTNNFDRSHKYRRSMYEPRTTENKKKLFPHEKNVKFADEVQNTPYSNNVDSYNYKNNAEVPNPSCKSERKNSVSSNESYSCEPNTTLTEKAINDHSKMGWENNSNRFPSFSNKIEHTGLKKSFIESRNNDRLGMIPEVSGKNADSLHKNKLKHSALVYQNDLRNGFVKFENESVCSGTDEGFESMRNSVVSEEIYRTSPFDELLNNTLTANNNSYVENQNIKQNFGRSQNNLTHSINNQLNTNNDHSTITCSLDSLVKESKLSLPPNPEDMRGATSVVLDNQLMLNSANGNFWGSSDGNAPNKSSTSTLKSSGSGLHLETLNLSPDAKNIDFENEIKKNSIDSAKDIQKCPNRFQSFTSYQESLQYVINEQSTKETNNNYDQKQLRTNSKERNSRSETKQSRSQTISDLTNRLSQPKKPPSLQISGQSTSPFPPSKTEKIEKPRTPSSESFKRGSSRRVTLPAKVAEKYKNFAQNNKSQTESPCVSKHSINSNTSICINNLPPKPPARTSSKSDFENSKNSPKILENSRTFFNNSFMTPKESKRSEKPKISPNSSVTGFSLKKLMSGKRQVSPNPIDTPKLTRPTKPRTQILTSYKR